MSSNGDWIDVRIAESRGQHPLVPDPVSVRMKELLKGQLGERQLTKSELANVARQLIAGMIPSPPSGSLKK